jgi:hypothetical protein
MVKDGFPSHTHFQFALFLKSMTDIYDEISREQTIFQKEIHDKVHILHNTQLKKSSLILDFPSGDRSIAKLASSGV